ncbi:hypothetical protein GOODEAATRI_031556, partial [Goodea atripinnis]
KFCKNGFTNLSTDLPDHICETVDFIKITARSGSMGTIPHIATDGGITQVLTGPYATPWYAVESENPTVGNITKPSYPYLE